MRCLYRTGNLFNNAINAIVMILLLLQGREASDILQARDRNCRLRIPSERVRRWPTIVIKCMSDSEYSFLQIRNQLPSIFSLLIPKFQRRGWSQSFLILIKQIKQRWHHFFSQLLHISGADPGFFVGGGAPLRDGMTDRWRKQILKANTVKFRK